MSRTHVKPLASPKIYPSMRGPSLEETYQYVVTHRRPTTPLDMIATVSLDREWRLVWSWDVLPHLRADLGLPSVSRRGLGVMLSREDFSEEYWQSGA